MAIIELFDGSNEFKMEDVDKVQHLCGDKISPGYSLVLTDSRGITNNKNIELIIESFITSDPSMLLIINKQDKITPAFINILNGWLSSYSKNIKLGIVIEKVEDLNDYIELFKIEQTKYIMIILKIVNNTPPIGAILDRIMELSLDNILFLDIDHNIDLDYKAIATVIDSTTAKRREFMIMLQLSCGFPMCMFTKEQIGNIFISPLKTFFFFCASKVIIKPDLTAIHCNLLNKCSVNLLDVEHIIEAHYKLDELEEKEQKNYQHCPIDKSCWSYKKLCGGGCLHR